MLKRLYELKEEVAAFLDSRNKKNLLEKFRFQGFQQLLVYLVDGHILGFACSQHSTLREKRQWASWHFAVFHVKTSHQENPY